MIFFPLSHSLELSSTCFDSTYREMFKLCYLRLSEAFETAFFTRSPSVQSKGQENGAKIALCHSDILIDGM